MSKNLIVYIEKRIQREDNPGIKEMLEDQLVRLKDGSFFEKNEHVETIEENRKRIAKESRNIIDRQAKITDVEMKKSPASKTESNVIKKEKESSKEIVIQDNQIDEFAQKLHDSWIEWAHTLEDEDQKKGWVNFLTVVGNQGINGDYWTEKRKAAKRPWVLQMHGLLPDQARRPTQEERKKIWEENYGKTK